MARTATDWATWRASLREAPPSDLRALAEEAAQRARQRVEEVRAVQEAMRAVRETAHSPRREVSVTAGYGGVVVEVAFPTAAYKRLPAGELAKLVTATVAEAQRKVTASAAAAMAPVLPPGLDATALLSGEVDLTRLMPVSGLAAQAPGVPTTEG